MGVTGLRSAAEIVVEGRVQGVGYRYFVQELAQELGLRGYVRNLRDGRVEVLAIGSPETLRLVRQALFLLALRNGWQCGAVLHLRSDGRRRSMSLESCADDVVPVVITLGYGQMVH